MGSLPSKKSWRGTKWARSITSNTSCGSQKQEFLFPPSGGSWPLPCPVSRDSPTPIHSMNDCGLASLLQILNGFENASKRQWPGGVVRNQKFVDKSIKGYENAFFGTKDQCHQLSLTSSGFWKRDVSSKRVPLLGGKHISRNGPV